MRMMITVPDDLDQKFREAVVQKLGYKRGNIKTAILEAITNWTQEVLKDG